MVKNAAKRAGVIKTVTPNITTFICHSFATHLLENGTDIIPIDL